MFVCFEILQTFMLFNLYDGIFAASFMLLYLNEYQMAQAVYTFHGDSRLWLESITKAQV